MKATIEFDSTNFALLGFDLSTPEGQLAHRRATKAPDAYLALWDVGQEIFRPARKHGYMGETELNKLLDGEHSEAVQEVVHLLEKKFYAILEERGISADDLW